MIIINVDIPKKRIKKEIKLYQRNAPQKIVFSRDDFEKRLGIKETHDIIEVIEKFGFGDLYDYNSGKPNALGMKKVEAFR